MNDIITIMKPPGLVSNPPDKVKPLEPRLTSVAEPRVGFTLLVDEQKYPDC